VVSFLLFLNKRQLSSATLESFGSTFPIVENACAMLAAGLRKRAKLGSRGAERFNFAEPAEAIGRAQTKVGTSTNGSALLLTLSARTGQQSRNAGVELDNRAVHERKRSNKPDCQRYDSQAVFKA
jgi:hypothetical protein